MDNFRLRIKPLEEINNENFYFSGNGIYEEPVRGAFFYIDDTEAIEDKSVSIEEAFVEFVNIAEFITPLVFATREKEEGQQIKVIYYPDGVIWREDTPSDPHELLKYSSEVKDDEVIKSELIEVVVSFISKYGYVHRRKDFPSMRPHEGFNLYQNLKIFEKSRKSMNKERMKKALDKARDSFFEYTKTAGKKLTKEQKEKTMEYYRLSTPASYYIDTLKCYTKCYKNSNYYDERHSKEKERVKYLRNQLEEKLKKLDRDDYETHLCLCKEYDSNLEDIHPDEYYEIEGAARYAAKILRPYENYINKYGLLELEGIWDYYECAALLLDGFYLTLASFGDEDSLARLKRFFHVYDFQPIDDYKGPIVKVVTFESVQEDPFNPFQCNFENPVVYNGKEYAPVNDNIASKFNYKTNMSYVVCEPHENILSDDALIRGHIKTLTERFVKYQVNKNYKNRFFEGQVVRSRSDEYSLFSFDTDLTRTFWNYLNYLIENNVVFKILHCERCGRIKIIKREGKGKFCDHGNCRMASHRNDDSHTYAEEKQDLNDFLRNSSPEPDTNEEEFGVPNHEAEDCKVIDFSENDCELSAYKMELLRILPNWIRKEFLKYM